ncbi:MAG: hypothetical protein BGO39_20880 [Chloroflexi bacterium 54-19]|nr:MAG: hypothetical protein BGO39_20880 [Chloroflexi bacterium 54-19]
MEQENDNLIYGNNYSLLVGDQELASYHQQNIPSYQDNPLIGTLPGIWTEDDYLEMLTYDPGVEEELRYLSPDERMHVLFETGNFFMPMTIHYNIATKISIALRSGLVFRNPIKPTFRKDVLERIAATEPGENNTGEKGPRVRNFPSRASGFTIIGTSGVGKSYSLETILMLYPQVYYHSQYKGQPFTFIQITWLKIECPYDGLISSLCTNFFDAVDNILNTQYHKNYVDKRGSTIQSKVKGMKTVCGNHCVGLLVIDEIQRLKAAKNGGDSLMLNFFVQLVNMMGVPVILVGTPKAKVLMSEEFSQARRASGMGDVVWDRMSNDDDWKCFLEGIWDYQYVQKPVKLNERFIDVLYEVSQGIIDIAVKAFLLSQMKAIVDKTETLTEELIRTVATESFHLANPILTALRLGDTDALKRYEDVELESLDYYLRKMLNSNGKETGIQEDAKKPHEVSKKPVSNSKNHTSNSKPSEGIKVEPTPRRRSKKPDTQNTGLIKIVREGENKNLTAYEALSSEGYIKDPQEYLNP